MLKHQFKLPVSRYSALYDISIPKDDELWRLQVTQAFRDTAKLRYRIEAKNAELKTKHGMRKREAPSFFKSRVIKLF